MGRGTLLRAAPSDRFLAAERGRASAGIGRTRRDSIVSDAAPVERPRPRERRQTRTADLDRRALAWVALVAMMVVAGALFLYETRATATWFDEWEWVLGRRGDDVGTFLRPHNGHLSLVPIAIYRVLFATAGLEHYGPYRA